MSGFTKLAAGALLLFIQSGPHPFPLVIHGVPREKAGDERRGQIVPLFAAGSQWPKSCMSCAIGVTRVENANKGY